ncbi:MAG: hypothetical protein DHS20C17_35400 [Cyclobacteriaceae bacterium]|nr:MAG: hypothetical protein DHS20C17_35400 [Cyclobacteriaceae bacterium]
MVKGQYAETIRSGRPGASIGPFTVGSNVFQIQSGVNLGKMDSEIETASSTNATTVIRYGVLEWLEVSALANYASINHTEPGPGFRSKGINAAHIGFRVNIRDGKGRGPNIGFQSRLKLNVLSEDFDQPRVGTASILILSQSLGNKLGLTVNTGIVTSGNPEIKNPTGRYTLNLSMPVSQRVSVFIESFGSLFEGDLDTAFDTGLAYLANPDLQFDLSLGYGKNEGIQDYFVDFGFSWRTRWGSE